MALYEYGIIWIWHYMALYEYGIKFYIWPFQKQVWHRAPLQIGLQWSSTWRPDSALAESRGDQHMADVRWFLSSLDFSFLAKKSEQRWVLAVFFLDQVSASSHVHRLESIWCYFLGSIGYIPNLPLTSQGLLTLYLQIFWCPKFVGCIPRLDHDN